MKIAVLGGGFTGLTAACHLQKKGHSVTIYEKESILGGLASGFKAKNWDWYLERTYHHIFASDDDILTFAKEVGFSKFIFREPETASLINSRIFPVDTPQDFLKLPILSWPAKFRAGAVLAFLKLSPFLSIYEKTTAAGFLKKTMGEEGWRVLWQQLFRKKFGKYAKNIVASFIWARIKKRTKSLGYVEGGFQTFIDYLKNKLTSSRVNVLTDSTINKIAKKGNRFIINGEIFDSVISTLPTPVLIKIGENILPETYLKQLKKIQYLHAVTLILETDKPILDKTYWLNIIDKKVPLMAIVQHTNFMDKKHYNNHHLTYIGWYVGLEDRIWKMEDGKLVDFVLPFLKKIKNSKFEIKNYYVFRAPWAQPIFDKTFLKSKPDFVTPVKNFYIANLDMTYPYDRGTNYAVKLGREVSELIT